MLMVGIWKRKCYKSAPQWARGMMSKSRRDSWPAPTQKSAVSPSSAWSISQQPSVTKSSVLRGEYIQEKRILIAMESASPAQIK